MDRLCILGVYRNITCLHLKELYATVDKEPIIYWIFDSNILENARLEYEESDSGDLCHINICNIIDDHAEEIFKNNFRYRDCMICYKGTDRDFNPELFEQLTGYELRIDME